MPVPTTRFMRKGVTRVFLVPTIASLAAPTVAEITAGDELTADIAAINGFEFTNSPIQVPDMASAFTSQIGGEDTTADSNMEFWEKGTTDATHDALVKGTAGYIVFFYQGTAGASPAANDDCEVWPCVVTSNSRMYSADNEAAKYRVAFSLTDPPEQAATVAA